MKNNLIDDFLQVMNGYGKDEKTIKSYKICMMEMKRYVFQDQDFSIEDLRVKLADDYRINWLEIKRKEGLKCSSLNQRISCLRTFYKWLIGRQEISLNIADSIPLYENKTNEAKEPLTLLECKKLLDYVRNEMILDTNIYSTRNNLIVSIFLAAGLRIDEVKNLNISNFDYDNKCINLTKTKFSKKRSVSIPNQIFEDLDLYLEFRNRLNNKLNQDLQDCLFISKKYNRLSDVQIRKIIYKLYEELDIKDKDVHSLRKSYVTNLIASGAEVHEVSAQVGHTRTSTTLNIYNRPQLKDLSEFNILFKQENHKKEVKKESKKIINKDDNVIQIQFGTSII